MMTVTNEMIDGKMFNRAHGHIGGLQYTIDGEVVTYRHFWRVREEAESAVAARLPDNWLSLCKASL